MAAYKEFKSAFEIKGFLEGKTMINYGGEGTHDYVIRKGLLTRINRRSGEESTTSNITAEVLNEKTWVEIPKPKSTMYRHYYWARSHGNDKIDVYKRATTEKTWDEWNANGGHYEFDRTEVIK